MTEITLTVAEAYRRAVAAFEAGDVASAQRFVEAILAADPRHTDALSLLGSIRFQQGNYREALALADALLEVSPGSPLALSNRACALAAMQRRAAALTSFDDALRAHGHDATPFLAALLTNRARLLVVLNRDQEAVKDFDRALAIRPDSVDTRRRRGAILRRLQRQQEALDDFTAVLAAEGRDVAALRHRGEILLGVGRYQEALQDFDLALSINPDTLEAHRGRGVALAHLGELAEASESLDRALSLRGGPSAAPPVVPAQAGTHTSQPIEGTQSMGPRAKGRLRPSSRAMHGDDAESAVCAPLHIEVVPLAGLDRIAEAWDALADRAAEPNVFFERSFLLPAASALRPDCRALLVWSDGAQRQLLALLPVFAEPRLSGLPFAANIGWVHRFSPLGTPLIDRDAVDEVIEAILDRLGAQPQWPKFLILPRVWEQGPIASTLFRIAAARGDHIAFYDRSSRAALMPPTDRDGYLERNRSHKRRSELRRQRRRLEEFGPVSLTSSRDPPAVDAAMTRYVELEARGWKGRAGINVAADAAVMRFMRGAVRALAAERKAQIHELRIGDRVAAAVIALTSGHRAWWWHTTYDEEFASGSPGIQVTLETSRALLAEPRLTHFDSGAKEDHPMIDSLWRDRLAVAGCIIAPGTTPALGFEVARKATEF